MNMKHINILKQNPFQIDVFKIIQPNCRIASVGLKDALYTTPIHNAYQSYFKFMWYQKVQKYLGMPNKYFDAMRIFTKMLKPQFGTLRKHGFISVIFLDDSYLQGNARGECLENVHETLSLLTSLGFTIHKEIQFQNQHSAQSCQVLL